MAITTPPTIATLSTPPTTADPTTFDTRADTFLSELTPWAGDLGDVADNVFDNATEAFNKATAADASAVAALASQTAAAASAASALGAPGTNATSTTSTATGTGSKTITIQTGKAYSVGQSVIIARTSDPSGVRMGGAITAYNSGTGSLTVNVSIAIGSGTYTDWTVSLGVIANAGILPPIPITSGGSLTATVNVNYLMDANGIVLGAPTTKAVGDLWQGQIMGSASGCSLDFGADLAFKRTPGVMQITGQNFRFKFQWSGATYGWIEA